MTRHPYPAYTPSGVAWLGDMPEHWELKIFRHIAYMKGRIGWQGLKQSEFSMNEDDPFLITGMNFKDGKINWSEVYHVSEERYDEAPEIQLKSGDLLITKDGTIGKLLLIDEIPFPGKASLNSHLLVIRPLKNSFFTKYLFYQFSSKQFEAFIDLKKTGTTFYGLTQEAIGEYKMLLPPLTEQRAIAAFLDRETGRMDTLIAKKRRRLELLKEQRAALISRAVTKGLDASVKLKPSGVAWLGDVPEHWEIKKLKYVAHSCTGFAFNSDDYIDDGIPLIRIGDILQDGNIDIENAKKLPEEYLQRYHFVRIEKNDILMAMTGATIGKAGQYQFEEPGLLNQRVCKFVPHSIDTKFLWYILKSEQYLEHIKLTGFGGAQPNISDVQLLDFSFAFPPLHEQQAIAAYLDRETAKLDALAAKVETVIARLAEYRTALVSAAVTGKIDVRTTR